VSNDVLIMIALAVGGALLAALPDIWRALTSGRHQNGVHTAAE
jgi:hypothetical protein